MTLMFTKKDNIKGGDLFFPEYDNNGILFKLESDAVICFRGTTQMHGVTNVTREDKADSALRITGVAYVK